MSDTERALEALKRNQNRRAQFFLRRTLDEETRYMEINGHIFHNDPSKDDGKFTNRWCQAAGCEMSHPAHAEKWPCPASAEGLEWDDYDRRDRKRREWEEEHEWGDDNE